jgi:two-component system sensor histidine kinase DesK
VKDADVDWKPVWRSKWHPIAFNVFLITVVFIGPAAEIVEGTARPAVVAVAALAAFAVLYFATLWMVYGRSEPIWQRWFPLVGLAAIAVSASIGFGRSWDGLFVFVAASAVTVAPRKWAPLALVAVMVIAAAALLEHNAGSDATGSLLFSILLSGLITLMLLRMRALIVELHRTREELARSAVAQERLRFSRDLHDLLGHTLSLIVVKAEVVRRMVPRDPEAAIREAGEIQDVGRRALVEVREAVTGYREGGLATELEGARTALAAAGIEATVREVGTPLPPEADTLVGWAVREGVTNVVRHSQASNCEIDIRRTDGRAVVEVRDDGVGTDSSATDGNGLRGLAERLSVAGGRVDAAPRAGGGFRLTVTVPIVWAIEAR